MAAVDGNDATISSSSGSSSSNHLTFSAPPDWFATFPSAADGQTHFPQGDSSQLVCVHCRTNYSGGSSCPNANCPGSSVPLFSSSHDDDDDDDEESDVTPLLTPPSMETVNEMSPAAAPSASEQHCHAHSAVMESIRQQGVTRVKRKLLLATCFCFVFAIGEGFGGYLSGSYAIVSDAAHMLSDFANLVIGLIAVSVSGVAPKRGYNFGLIRAEAIGALFSVLLIWNLAGVLLYESLVRIVHGDFEIQSTPMLIAGGCAVVFNVFMVFFLRGVPHSHSHGGGGSSHSHTKSTGHSHFQNEADDDESHSHSSSSSPRNHLNIRAATVHALGDVFQSTGVFIVSIIIKYYPNLKILDPVCSILFCGVVIYTTIGVFRDTVRILMEGFPRDYKYEEVEADLAAIPGVVRVHDLRMWSLTSDKNALSVHLVASEASAEDRETILQEATRIMRKKYLVSVITVQVELLREQVMDACEQCRPIQ